MEYLWSAFKLLSRPDRQDTLHFAIHPYLALVYPPTHKHPKVRAWIAARPRYHVHFTPTYASWLNQVQRWFGHITQQAIRLGSFRTVRELVRRIDAFVRHYNAGARSFAWTATADSIFPKLERLLKAISGTAH